VTTEALEALVERAAGDRVDADLLRDRYRGTLLGVAVGNALGLGHEGSSRASLRRHFPEGVSEVDPRERNSQWDDDLAQTVVLGEALLAADELDPDDVGARLLRWARENGRGMGVLIGEVVAGLAEGRSAMDAARAAWERGGWSTAGNGAIMRCAPVALRWRRRGARLVSTARTSALVTHYDPRCEWSTVAFDVALCFALAGKSLDLGELAGALQKVEEGEQPDEALDQVVEAVRSVPAADLDDLDLDDPMDMGYTLKAMQVGLWCLEQDRPLDVLLPRIVGAGGDTDTNGAVAGAALGARAGLGAIPGRWISGVRDSGLIEGLADDLFAASEGGERA
jgi:ADP-ribosyl-[dinitrogen reductase] hydrolase